MPKNKVSCQKSKKVIVYDEEARKYVCEFLFDI